ncbi:Uncharacterized protein APZ42_006888, partial [Daphnia magna]
LKLTSDLPASVHGPIAIRNGRLKCRARRPTIHSSQRNMVSASISPNHTFKLRVRFSPMNSSMVTSPPPFN